MSDLNLNDAEQEFVDNETAQNDASLDVHRRVFAIETASNLPGLFKSQDEFFEFVKAIEDYVK